MAVWSLQVRADPSRLVPQDDVEFAKASRASCLIPFPPTILESHTIMKTILSLSNPAEVETECLVAIVLDKAEKISGDKNRAASLD